MRILVYMLAEVGHIIPTFGLTRTLRHRGHEVIYLAPFDLQERIEKEGFRCIPVHEDILPSGRLEQIDGLSGDEHTWALIEYYVYRRQEEYFDGRMEACLSRIEPDLVLADVIVPDMLLLCHSLEVPCVAISTMLSQRVDELPPITSSLTPDSPALEIAAARVQSNLVVRSMFSRTGPYTQDLFTARFGYPVEHLTFDGTMMVVLKLVPEVLLCASAFDFPRQNRDQPPHIAIPVDLERHEDVPWALERFIDPARPLVYASLGSQTGRYPHARRFFEAVLEVFRAHPEWTLVLSVGRKYLDDPVFASRSENVLVLAGAPQVWLLRRAAVFVTHAGLGSVREAIALHVPLIAVPQQFDQPGNAARIAYHGIGHRLAADVVTAAGLASAIERVMRDAPELRLRLRTLDAASRKEETDARGVELIEEIACRPRPAVVWGNRPPVESPSKPIEAVRATGWVFVNEAGTIGRGDVLVVGSTLECSLSEPLRLGKHGFVMAPALARALGRACGSRLARVELCGDLVEHGDLLIGHTIRCLWVADLRRVLWHYAAWCAELVLQGHAESNPDLVEFFRACIRRHRELGEAAAARERMTASFEATLERAVSELFDGYGVAAWANAPDAHHAAKLARRHVIDVLARRRVGHRSGTREGVALYKEEQLLVGERVDAELERRVIGYLRDSGRDVSMVARNDARQ